MNKFQTVIQKTFAVILIITISAMSLISLPPKAHAQLATIDAGDIAQNTLSAISNAATEVSSYYLEYKESVLDGLAWTVAKSALSTLTTDVVNWINTGFSGSPSFVTNPLGFAS